MHSDAQLLARVGGMFDAIDPVPQSVVAAALNAFAARTGTGERAPSGCGWCGVSRHDHVQRYKEPVGWHGYVSPSQAQIKARMLARRRHTQRTRAVAR